MANLHEQKLPKQRTGNRFVPISQRRAKLDPPGHQYYVKCTATFAATYIMTSRVPTVRPYSYRQPTKFKIKI